MREDRKITTKNTPSLTDLLSEEKGHQVISCMFEQRKVKVKEKSIQHKRVRTGRRRWSERKNLMSNTVSDIYWVRET